MSTEASLRGFAAEAAEWSNWHASLWAASPNVSCRAVKEQASAIRRKLSLDGLYVPTKAPWFSAFSAKNSARVTADALDALGRAEEAKALRERYGATSSDDPKRHA